MGLRDRFNSFSGRTRFVVSRVFVHLVGQDVAPLLGVLNRAVREVMDADGDMQTLGEQLAQVCDRLLEYETFWRSAANEGDLTWDEGEAGDYVNDLFTDSAGRYGSAIDGAVDDVDSGEDWTIPITQNLVAILTVAFEGEVPELETNLADVEALNAGLKALINLHHRGTLRAVQIHFSPAQLGDNLTSDQLIEHFPELAPL
ncbi:MAG: DUF1517 domain-containing protein [Elainellaceae cyanobacterium]